MSHTIEEEMKANNAATKIQAGFRGYRVRKQMKETTKRGNGGSEIEDPSSPLPLKRGDSRTSLEEKSATKIQAGIRGFLVRKRHQQEQQAATRIQAGFRGFRTRKALKQKGQ